MKKELLLLVLLISSCQSTITESIDEKFFSIDQKLQTEIKAIKKSSDLLIEQNPLPKVKALHEETEKINGFIEQTRSRLDSIAHGEENEEPDYRNVKAQTDLMVGIKNDGIGYELEAKLNNYIAYVNSLSESISFDKIAKKGSEVEQFKDSENADKDFVYLNFERVPISAAFVILSELQKEVQETEIEAIKLLIELEGKE